MGYGGFFCSLLHYYHFEFRLTCTDDGTVPVTLSLGGFLPLAFVDAEKRS